MLYLNNISYFDFPYKHFICKDILEQKNIDNIQVGVLSNPE